MALLDVSEVLLDPDFMDTLTCYRKTQAVGDDGIASVTSQTIPFYGVVTSDSGDILERIATGERIKGSITIHSTFPLRDGSGSTQTADEVLFHGQMYIVSTVNDYSHFGQGFVAATCDLKPLAG